MARNQADRYAHTPGPFVVRQYQSGGGIGYAIDAPDARRLSIANDILSLADANLFAAGPDMLEALRQAHVVLTVAEQSGDEGVAETLAVIRAAIDKAEGR